MSTWHSIADKPEVGCRIIAPYNDGSGARMFLVVEGEDDGTALIDQDGDEYDWDYLDDSASFGVWAYLPDDFELWFEIREDNRVA